MLTNCQPSQQIVNSCCNCALPSFCFRMIGHYVRHIKSRKHPEKNVMVRMLWERSVHQQRISTLGIEPQCDDEDVGVAPSCTNSSTPSGTVYWPALTRNNSRIAHGSSQDRCKGDHSCCVALLTAYLGRDRAKEVLAGAEHAIQLKVLTMDASKLTIGTWTYATCLRESKSQNLKTSQAWFAISARHVPKFADRVRELAKDDVDPAPLESHLSRIFYGRFRSFARVTVSGAQPGPVDFSIAECDIFRPVSTHEITGLSTFSTDEEEFNYPGAHVEMRHVICPIARGPVFNGWKEHKDDPKNPPTLVADLWVAMHIQK